MYSPEEKMKASKKKVHHIDRILGKCRNSVLSGGLLANSSTDNAKSSESMWVSIPVQALSLASWVNLG